MPKVNLSNYGPLGHRKTLEDTLLEKLNSLLERIRPGIQPWDVMTLMDSIKYGIYSLKQLKAPERRIGFSTIPHAAYIFSMDADGIQEALDDISNIENPTANLAALGDSFVPEVCSALLQVLALVLQKQREYEAMEATGGRRKTRSARKHGSNRKTRNTKTRRHNTITREKVS